MEEVNDYKNIDYSKLDLKELNFELSIIQNKMRFLVEETIKKSGGECSVGFVIKDGKNKEYHSLDEAKKELEFQINMSKYKKAS